MSNKSDFLHYFKYFFCSLVPGHKDDFAGVKKLLREKLKGEVGLDQTRRRNQVQIGKEATGLEQIKKVLGITGVKLPRRGIGETQQKFIKFHIEVNI